MKLKLFLFLAGCTFTAQVFAQQGFPFDNEVRVFKHQDSIRMPGPGGILFIGSSSIRKWTDLELRFAGKPIIRRGVGGSELWQWVDYYTPYLLFPYQPRKIFIYAGENDIAAGRSPRFVADEFAKLWVMINHKLPNTEIYFMSIKPSPVRAKNYAAVYQADELIKTYIKNKPKTHYVDVASAIYKPGTTLPDSSLFNSDYLHLNSKGYDKWQTVLKPIVN